MCGRFVRRGGTYLPPKPSCLLNPTRYRKKSRGAGRSSCEQTDRGLRGRTLLARRGVCVCVCEREREPEGEGNVVDGGRTLRARRGEREDSLDHVGHVRDAKPAPRDPPRLRNARRSKVCMPSPGGGGMSSTSNPPPATPERLVFYCRTTSASTAPPTPRKTCGPDAPAECELKGMAGDPGDGSCTPHDSLDRTV